MERTTLPITKSFICKLLDKNGALSSQKLREIDARATPEHLYLVWHDMSGPGKCQVCKKPTRFLSFTKGYRTYCSAKCSANSKSTINKRIKTNLLRHGVEYPFQSQSVKDKAIQTNVERYGVEYPFQSQDVKDKAIQTNVERYGVEYPNQCTSVRNKSKQTNVERYGVEYATQNSIINQKSKDNRLAVWLPKKLESLHTVVTPAFDIAEYTDVDKKYPWLCSDCNTGFTSRLSDGRIPRCPTCYPYGYRTSMVELEIADFIQELGFSVDSSNRSVIGPLELDLVIHAKKIAFEINGDYWHAERQGRDKNYHLNKSNLCNAAGYRLVHILASEWTSRAELVKSRIKSILGVNQRIHGRKCRVALIDKQTATTFLNTNHIQRTCPAKVCIGLQYQGEVVALMTFGKSRFDKSIDWELLRYASAQNTNVVGGASKLLAYFVSLYAPSSIISYCDMRWNTGGLYAAIGFTHTHTSPPNYWYTKDYLTLESRVKYQKHKLKNILSEFDPGLTEWENMQANGYDRIWDCGNSVWVYNHG